MIFHLLVVLLQEISIFIESLAVAFIWTSGLTTIASPKAQVKAMSLSLLACVSSFVFGVWECPKKRVNLIFSIVCRNVPVTLFCYCF